MITILIIFGIMIFFAIICWGICHVGKRADVFCDPDNPDYIDHFHSPEERMDMANEMAKAEDREWDRWK